jgi:uncharacterized membrane protein
LFLGSVPFIVAGCLKFFEQKLNNLLLFLGGCLWLLFYPNAPYMITDLIHVNSGSTIVLYDTIIIFSFAMLSAFLGFYSIALMYFLIDERFSLLWARVIITISLLLSSFGIYLGRILRLNSWDIFTKPLETFATIFEHLFPIGKNPTTYAIIILFSLLQCMLLFLIIDIRQTKESK